MGDTTVTGTNRLERFKDYVATRKGTVLATEIVLSLIVVICYASSRYTVYSTVGLGQMILASILFYVFMMGLDKEIRYINWLWTDLFRAVTGAPMFILTAMVNLIKWKGDSAWTAAGVFSLFAGLVFAYDTYTIYLEIKGTRQQPLIDSTENNV